MVMFSFGPIKKRNCQQVVVPVPNHKLLLIIPVLFNNTVRLLIPIVANNTNGVIIKYQIVFDNMGCSLPMSTLGAFFFVIVSMGVVLLPC